MINDFTEYPSSQATEVLKLLRDHHNVLISGPPASGKSRLLAEVAYWFTQIDGPTYSATGSNPFPDGAEAATYLPSPERRSRHVFHTTFHQGTKYRDFVRGLLPDPGGDPHSFRLINGTFLDAAESADVENSAALLSIDEINRGPAVSIFGDVIGVLETEKRKDSSGQLTPTSQPIRILSTDRTMKPYFVSRHLYVVAAMNEADTSVEGLDVAFRRRFAPIRIEPDTTIARTHLAITDQEAPLPENDETPAQVLEALVQSWACLNRKITLTSGQAFRIGHGIFFESAKPDVSKMHEVNSYAYTVFRRIEDHLSEVFYGDTQLLGALLGSGTKMTPYKLQEESIGGVVGIELLADPPVSKTNIYQTLRAIAQA